MATVRQELAYWTAAARGAIEWHLEAGEAALAVDEAFRFPPLGRMELSPLPEGVVQAVSIGPDESAEAKTVAVPTPGQVPTQAPVPQLAQPPVPQLAQPPVVQPQHLPPTPIAQTPVEAPSSVPRVLPEGDRAAAAAALQIIRDDIGDCQRCGLCQHRQELVFGSGDPRARVLFVSEAPGVVEDQIGLPFVDAAGLLLGKMIRAMGLKRSSVYLTYTVKCLPDGEINDKTLSSCQPFLAREIDTIRPEIIVTLGGYAARALLGSARAIPRMRGEWAEYKEIPVLPTFHPIAVVQSPELKAPVWQDLQKVMRKLAEKKSTTEQ